MPVSLYRLKAFRLFGMWTYGRLELIPEDVPIMTCFVMSWLYNLGPCGPVNQV